MIERHWKGICKPGEAGHYRRHLINDTFKQLAQLKGYKGARVLTRAVAVGTEFLVITLWETLVDIKQFAGDSIETAVVPAPVRAMMLEYSTTAMHYEVMVYNP